MDLARRTFVACLAAVLMLAIPGRLCAQEEAPAKKPAKKAAAAAAAPKAAPAPKAGDDTIPVIEVPNPGVEAILANNPRTPEELTRSAKILADLGRPDLAKGFLRRVLAAEPGQKQLAAMVEQYGSAMFTAMAGRADLSPEGKQLAALALDAAERESRDPAEAGGLDPPAPGPVARRPLRGRRIAGPGAGCGGRSAVGGVGRPRPRGRAGQRKSRAPAAERRRRPPAGRRPGVREPADCGQGRRDARRAEGPGRGRLPPGPLRLGAKRRRSPQSGWRRAAKPAGPVAQPGRGRAAFGPTGGRVFQPPASAPRGHRRAIGDLGLGRGGPRPRGPPRAGRRCPANAGRPLCPRGLRRAAG